jgi:hypothetical protein
MPYTPSFKIPTTPRWRTARRCASRWPPAWCRLATINDELVESEHVAGPLLTPDSLLQQSEPSTTPRGTARKSNCPCYSRQQEHHKFKVIRPNSLKRVGEEIGRIARETLVDFVFTRNALTSTFLLFIFPCAVLDQPDSILVQRDGASRRLAPLLVTA